MSEMLFRSLHIPINIYKTTILYGYKTKDLRKFSYQSALLETKLEIISNNKGGKGGREGQWRQHMKSLFVAKEVVLITESNKKILIFIS